MLESAKELKSDKHSSLLCRSDEEKKFFNTDARTSGGQSLTKAMKKRERERKKRRARMERRRAGGPIVYAFLRL